MAKKQKEEEPKKETPEEGEEETPEEEAGKWYDVVDINGDLLNIYKDKKVADAFAGKVQGRKVVPSPKGRTREDVSDAILLKKQERLKKLEGNEQVLDKF